MVTQIFWLWLVLRLLYRVERTMQFEKHAGRSEKERCPRNAGGDDSGVMSGRSFDHLLYCGTCCGASDSVETAENLIFRRRSADERCRDFEHEQKSGRDRKDHVVRERGGGP